MTSIDWERWHALMIERGWTPCRDIFGVIIKYELGGRALNAAHFAQWANLMDTPPPF